MSGFRLIAFVILGVFAFPEDRTQAQSILVEVVEAETTRPISGAFVTVLNEDGVGLRSGLTNEDGLLRLGVQQPGVFSVRAEMIGRETGLRQGLEIREAESRAIRLSLPVSAIPLRGIRVEADQRCILRPGEGLALARVWGEARKALRIQEWAESEGLYRFRVEAYERDLDPDELVVAGERRRVTGGITVNPIVSLPWEDLETDGFMRPAPDGGYDYYAPDASVLLSDGFLDSHCFRLTSHRSDPELLGLAFEPVSAGRRPDIAGTFWIRRASAALESIDFTYTHLPWEEAAGLASGHLELEALPTGAWIVREWWIRMPEMVQDLSLARGRDSGIRLKSLKEAGGGVTEILEAGGRVVSRAEPGILSGLVWDSTNSEGLVGALVYLSGTSYSTHSDSAGRFELGGLPEGVFRATFSHPRLDSLGTFARSVEVDVRSGRTSEIQLNAPSLGHVLASRCPGRRTDDRELPAAILTGRVQADGARPLPSDARVTVEWHRYGLSSTGWHRAPRARPGNLTRERLHIQDDRMWMETAPDSSGHFLFCEVPADWLLIVQAHTGSRRSDTVHVRTHRNEPAFVELSVGTRTVGGEESRGSPGEAGAGLEFPGVGSP